VFADSGNGAHLLYPVDLPNDKNTARLFALSHAALDKRFGDEVVGIDGQVSIASRAWKIYGTAAAKGTSTVDRPHRLARLLSVPARLTPMPAAHLVRIFHNLQMDG
jgi:hypothetical protein